MPRTLSLKLDAGPASPRWTPIIVRGQSHDELRADAILEDRRPTRYLTGWRSRFANLRVLPARHDVFDAESVPPSVRSLCPFCGSANEPSCTSPCCDQWVEMTAASVATPSETDGALRLAENMTAIADRLNRASQLLVVLLASSIIAMLLSLGRQSSQSGGDEPAREVARATNRIAPLTVEPAPAATIEMAAAAISVVDASPSAARPGSAEPAPPTAPIEVAAAPSIDDSPPPGEEWAPEFRVKWAHLNRMMSRTAVRALLGEPKWVDKLSTPHVEYWLYKDATPRGEGWIAFFDAGGPVCRWWTFEPSA